MGPKGRRRNRNITQIKRTEIAKLKELELISPEALRMMKAAAFTARAG